MLTFGQRVPAGPVGDTLVEEIPAVPALVHPAVGVRVGPRQLSSHTNRPHCYHAQTVTELRRARRLVRGQSFFSAAHLSEDLVVRGGRVRVPPPDARVPRLVERVVGHHGSPVEVG